MGVYMLSVNKVKQHGFHDNRWTLHDSTRQYRGLINLLKREKRIIKTDNKVEIKKQRHDYTYLNRAILSNRVELKKIIYGDKQFIRNILAVDKNLQLAYENLNINVISDRIFQETFHQRRILDSLHHRLNNKIDLLGNLKLTTDKLTIMTSDPNRAKLAKKIGIVTGKVQDMILKKEGAITVKNAYRAIIQVMTKDACYYESLLQTLYSDSLLQGKHIFESTILGQTATEQLDDYRCEYNKLEAIIQGDKKIRKSNLDSVKAQLQGTVKNLRAVIRTDSASKTFETVNVDTTLQNQIKGIETTLNNMKNLTLVSNFENIFPCFKEQAKAKERLSNLCDTLKDRRNKLIKLRTHMEYKLNDLLNTTTASLNAYKGTKREKKEAIETIKLKIQQQENKKIKGGQVIVEIRNVLQNLYAITSKFTSINGQIVFVPTKETVKFTNNEGVRIDDNGKELIHAVEKQLMLLIYAPVESGAAGALDKAQVAFNEYTGHTGKFIDFSTTRTDADVEPVEELTFEDASIPTNASIKKDGNDTIARAIAMAQQQP